MPRKRKYKNVSGNPEAAIEAYLVILKNLKEKYELRDPHPVLKRSDAYKEINAKLNFFFKQLSVDETLELLKFLNGDTFFQIKNYEKTDTNSIKIIGDAVLNDFSSEYILPKIKIDCVDGDLHANADSNNFPKTINGDIFVYGSQKPNKPDNSKINYPEKCNNAYFIGCSFQKWNNEIADHKDLIFFNCPFLEEFTTKCEGEFFGFNTKYPFKNILLSETHCSKLGIKL